MAPCIFTKLRGVCMIFMHIAEVVVVPRDSTGANSVTARATARNAMFDGLREIVVVEAPPTFGNLFTPRFIKNIGRVLSKKLRLRLFYMYLYCAFHGIPPNSKTHETLF